MPMEVADGAPFNAPDTGRFPQSKNPLGLKAERH